VYLVVGKMTGRLAELRPGRRLDLWGPLGNGFAPHTSGRLVMVAGGIGQTPFMAQAREALGLRAYGREESGVRSQESGGEKRNSASLNPESRILVPAPLLLYGARTKAYLAGVDDFERLGVEVRVSTDDGTAGHHGFVTDLLSEQLRAAKDRKTLRVVCCGPEPMMHAVAKMTAQAGVRCEVSLETPMACGVGICFTCVAKVRQADGHWDYRRTCVEGPVFDAAQIVFD
jgi:dihydroorotate dehydrogenase electron transfer subunit